MKKTHYVGIALGTLLALAAMELVVLKWTQHKKNSKQTISK